MTVLNLQVAASADDAVERANGTGFSSVSATLQAKSYPDDTARWNMAYRFANVTVPAGATITSAVAQLYIDTGFADDPNLDIAFEDVDSAANFSDTADVTSRARTAAVASWIASNVQTGGAGYYATPDISAPLQEVIDRVGWASGNAVCVLFLGNVTPGETFSVEARSYDESSTHAAKLDITYTEPGGGALIEGKLVGRGILGGRLVA